MIIKADTIRNLNQGVNAAELILGDLVAYRKANKLNGFAVIYDESDIDSFSRKSNALLNGLYDLMSWVKVNGGELRIFTNANGEAAIKFQDESKEKGSELGNASDNLKGREMLLKAQTMRENASVNRGYNANHSSKAERMLLGRADVLEAKALSLMTF